MAGRCGIQTVIIFSKSWITTVVFGFSNRDVNFEHSLFGQHLASKHLKRDRKKESCESDG
jgi:hypothetical protein